MPTARRAMLGRKNIFDRNKKWAEHTLNPLCKVTRNERITYQPLKVSRSIPDLPGAKILFGSKARLRVCSKRRLTGP